MKEDDEELEQQSGLQRIAMQGMEDGKANIPTNSFVWIGGDRFDNTTPEFFAYMFGHSVSMLEKVHEQNKKLITNRRINLILDIIIVLYLIIAVISYGFVG